MLNIWRVSQGRFSSSGWFWFRERNAMKVTTALGALGGALIVGFFASPAATAAPIRGWLNWRGPQQNGSSLEKNLPDKLQTKDALWVADFPGQSTPVIANGKL